MRYLCLGCLTGRRLAGQSLLSESSLAVRFLVVLEDDDDDDESRVRIHYFNPAEKSQVTRETDSRWENRTAVRESKMGRELYLFRSDAAPIPPRSVRSLAIPASLER